MAKVADKLRTKFQVEEEDIIDVLKQIARIAEIVKPTAKIRLVDDDPDNRIVECAVHSQVDLVVSGDKHLLRVKKYQDIPIVRAADLLHSFPKK